MGKSITDFLSNPAMRKLNPHLSNPEPNGRPLVEVLCGLKQPKSKFSYEEERLNKLEASFWKYLQTIRPVCKPHAITLRLASKVRYTPDFYSIGPNGEVEFWETKGFMRDDARKSLLFAARTYPEFSFYLVTRKKGSSEFDIKPITP